MKYDAALKYYKTNAAMARAAGVSKQAITRWKDSGVVPETSAWRLNAHSRGRLKMNLKDYDAAPAAPAQPA